MSKHPFIHSRYIKALNDLRRHKVELMANGWNKRNMLYGMDVEKATCHDDVPALIIVMANMACIRDIASGYIELLCINGQESRWTKDQGWMPGYLWEHEFQLDIDL